MLPPEIQDIEVMVTDCLKSSLTLYITPLRHEFWKKRFIF